MAADIEKGKNPGVVRWSMPTTNVDGSPIADPSSLTIKIYRRDYDTADPYVEFMTLVGSLQTDGIWEAPLPDFPEGGHEIVLTATDAEGDESGYSNSMGFTIGVAPSAPVIEE
jgi:hypothetical protein